MSSRERGLSGSVVGRTTGHAAATIPNPESSLRRPKAFTVNGIRTSCHLVRRRLVLRNCVRILDCVLLRDSESVGLGRFPRGEQTQGGRGETHGRE